MKIYGKETYMKINGMLYSQKIAFMYDNIECFNPNGECKMTKCEIKVRNLVDELESEGKTIEEIEDLFEKRMDIKKECKIWNYHKGNYSGSDDIIPKDDLIVVRYGSGICQNEPPYSDVVGKLISGGKYFVTESYTQSDNRPAILHHLEDSIKLYSHMYPMMGDYQQLTMSFTWSLYSDYIKYHDKLSVSFDCETMEKMKNEK